MNDSHTPNVLAYWNTTDTTVPSPADLHSLQREASHEYIHYSSGSCIYYSSKQSKFLFQNFGGHFITTQEFPDAD